MKASLAEPSGRSCGRTTVLGAVVLQDVAPSRESEVSSHRSYDHTRGRRSMTSPLRERADRLAVGRRY